MLIETIQKRQDCGRIPEYVGQFKRAYERVQSGFGPNSVALAYCFREKAVSRGLPRIIRYRHVWRSGCISEQISYRAAFLCVKQMEFIGEYEVKTSLSAERFPTKRIEVSEEVSRK